jgi:hypothetical protein
MSTKPYDWSKFTEKIAVKNATPQEMYDWWSRAENLEKWFLKRADYLRDGKAIPKNESCKTGDNYEWEWYGYDVMEEGEVLEANGKDLFKFTFANGCTVTVKFDLFKDYTIITLTQENIPVTEEAKVSTHLGCSQGWQFYLCNIKSIAEGGIDIRNKDPEVRGVINS